VDWFAQAWATPGLGWLVVAAFAGGLVRGFSGFGTAMIYLPVAGQILPPFAALVTLTVMDILGPVLTLPRVLGDAHLRDVARLGAGFVVAAPAGLALLAVTDPAVFRYAVSIVSLLLLVALIGGLRYRGRISRAMVYGIGGAGGFMGGVAGLPGPPVILFYMARDQAPAVIRANTMLYLILADVVIFSTLVLGGQVGAATVALGLVLMIPCMLANRLGAAIFRPEAAGAYRAAAYAIIAVSALGGLPFFD
jgi:hypothetical protein